MELFNKIETFLHTIRNGITYRATLQKAYDAVKEFKLHLNHEGTGTEKALIKVLSFERTDASHWSFFLYASKSIILAAGNTGCYAKKAIDAIHNAAKVLGDLHYEKIMEADRKMGDTIIEQCYAEMFPV